MVVSASDPIGDRRRDERHRGARGLAKRSAASVSSVRPEYDARNHDRLRIQALGARQISSYER